MAGALTALRLGAPQAPGSAPMGAACSLLPDERRPVSFRRYDSARVAPRPRVVALLRNCKPDGSERPAAGTIVARLAIMSEIAQHEQRPMNNPLQIPAWCHMHGIGGF